MRVVKSQFLPLCYSKCWISPVKSLKKNPRSSASTPAYVSGWFSCGDPEKLWNSTELWLGYGLRGGRAVLLKTLLSPAALCAAPLEQPPRHLCWGSSPVVAERARKGRPAKLVSGPGSGCVTSSGVPDGAERSIWGLEVKSECHHHAEAWPDQSSRSCLGTELNTAPLLLPPW